MRRLHNLLPRAGGWQDQPLKLLVHAQAIESTIALHRKFRTEGFDWTTLSQNEIALNNWIGMENGR